MNIDNIHKIELEITSNCNAACPGCSRTQYPDLLKIESLTLVDIKRLFPTERHIKNKQFKFCGVLGDPALNSECVDMVEYLTSHGGYCQLSTNGGIQPATWWHRLGQLSKSTGLVDINFCVDGHKETNHIYRVNTVFDTIARNMQAYADGGEGSAKAAWMYIVFDHNEHEQAAAEAHARELGFRFAIRTGMRNSLNSWTAQIKKRDAETKKLISKPQVITTTGVKEHSKKEVVENLITFIKEQNKDPLQTQEIISSIKCKLIHEGEIFIASNLTMWPCCFLWDSAFKDSSVDYINKKLAEYGGDWNSLTDKTIDEVLQHPWFDAILKDSWDPAHEKHLPRCIKTCAYNKAYQNEIKEKPAQ
jgi:MoaA/NifB/PqqE/SkfB family radical SAM enzyme